jgi:hypothetical protein
MALSAAPDPRLRPLLEKIDALERLLKSERYRAAQLRRVIARLQAGEPHGKSKHQVEQEQRPTC